MRLPDSPDVAALVDRLLAEAQPGRVLGRMLEPLAQQFFLQGRGHELVGWVGEWLETVLYPAPLDDPDARLARHATAAARLSALGYVPREVLAVLLPEVASLAEHLHHAPVSTDPSDRAARALALGRARTAHQALHAATLLLPEQSDQLVQSADVTWRAVADLLDRGLATLRAALPASVGPAIARAVESLRQLAAGTGTVDDTVSLDVVEHMALSHVAPLRQAATLFAARARIAPAGPGEMTAGFLRSLTGVGPAGGR